MHIQFNDEPLELTPGLTLAALLAQLDQGKAGAALAPVNRREEKVLSAICNISAPGNCLKQQNGVALAKQIT